MHAFVGIVSSETWPHNGHVRREVVITVPHGLPGRRRRGLSAREERAKLVAIEVAEVARVKSLAARACRAFVLPPQRDGALVNLVHLPLAFGRKRNHDAVA